nr:conserved oligomeric Golgi complex subunit 1 isoform X1 [Leptinotarsa decemlineata]
MSRNNNLLELDIDKLFEDRSVDEIIEIQKLLDLEIERKRNELRSMVGDRYKDVLAASDAIKSMKSISKEIVESIDKITNTCEQLIISPANADIKSNYQLEHKKVEERTVIIQIRLAIFINEQIWIALDEENNLRAAECYLLAQHIHTGLSLSKKEYLDKVALLNHIKSNLVVLRSKIFQKITDKLESVETSAQETSQNLNALLLLENQISNNLLSIFTEHRKTALNTVMNTPYSNVRMQVSSMVKCLMTTVRLLHDCFIGAQNGEKSLIWQQLQEIIGDSSPTTLSKLELPVTPLQTYIPEIIKQFRPTCKFSNSSETLLRDAETVLKVWLESTQKSVEVGLKKSLELIPNVKGLHLTREESLKIEPPDNWEQICKESHLPEHFDIWYFFFQNLITERCRNLISKKKALIIQEVQICISNTMEKATKSEKSESDLRYYMWTEDANDISKTENSHVGLSMKTKGYSPNIVELCSTLDKKYLELLEDVSQYLYGKEFNLEMIFPTVLNDYKFKRKSVDKVQLENHLQSECSKTSLELSQFVSNLLNKETEHLIAKSIICARFLQAIIELCPNFHKCCTFNNSADDWLKICDIFTKTSHVLWLNWVKDSVKRTEKECEILDDISPRSMLKMFTRWDEIEIQEQTEEKVFKSQIRVPLKPSLSLNEVLSKMNDDLCHILPHTLPKPIHLQFIQDNVGVIFRHYEKLSEKDLNQKQALQFLFDMKFMTTFCISRDNVELVSCSQDICDKLRSKIDPFDLDVFYSFLQNNVKRAIIQSQVIFGCLLPSSTQLASLGVLEKQREQDLSPSIIALSIPSTSSWFPLLPVTAPSQKMPGQSLKNAKEAPKKSSKVTPKKAQDPTSMMKQSAASLFGGLTTDWFS